MSIAILMGGWSKERAVSLKSGQNVYEALSADSVDCFMFDVTKKSLPSLWSQSFDKALIVLHGRGGEDGFIQKKLEQRQIPYSGSNSLVSKIGMDKETTKRLWLEQHLPTAKFTVSTNTQTVCPDFALPWIVKPACEGSSLGISKIIDKTQLKDALTLAHQYDNKVIIEQYINGKEYTIAILHHQALPIIEIDYSLDFLDYESKYINTTQTHHYCPASLDEATTKALQQLALKAFQVLGGKDWGRIDLMIENNQPYLLEVNTAPGMTKQSLVPIAVKASGVSLSYFIQQVLQIT